MIKLYFGCVYGLMFYIINYVPHKYGDFFVKGIFMLFFIMFVFDVLFLILSGIKIYEMSKTSNTSDNTRFDAEKERFE
jgi:uncharacterized membrane protein